MAPSARNQPEASNAPLALARPQAAGEATRLRVLAGTPHSRRGSVLVLVVGVLALLAIIIVVYTSVGQADVRSGRALVNKSRLDDQSAAIGDYIMRIIGDDASATKIQPISLANNSTAYLSVHETTDYPYTDPASRSILTANMLQQSPTTLGIRVPNEFAARFDPVGNITKPYTVNNSLDPRSASDPWLASTEATWINNHIGGNNSLGAMPAPGVLLGHQRDWQHFSTISPSGLPVNLANLRGNFNAASGFPTRPYSTTTPLMMSDWLHVWKPTVIGAGYQTPSNATQLSGQGYVDRYNSPATWSNDCTDTFRPVTWNPGNKLVLGDVKFMGNQLGDADGDGFYDSRWQELVDVSDPANPVNLLPGGTGGGVRWFVAPRIIDLSSMVNVNTATGFAVPPDAENPAGLTPSDVDLERLLMTADVRQYFGINPVTQLVDGGRFSGNGSAGALSVAGRWAFTGILEGRATGMTEVWDNPVAASDPAGPELTSPQWLREAGVVRTGGDPALGSVTRKVLYTMGGKDDSSGQLRSTGTSYYLKQTSGYGLADEAELRKFNGVNDPTSRSRLEAASQQVPTQPAMPPSFAYLTPLRPERDMTTDRDAGMAQNNNATINGEAMPRLFVQHFYDVRHLLTTISGARPFAFSTSVIPNPTTPTATAARPLADTEVRVDINPLLEKAVSASTAAVNANRSIYPLSSANTIFSNYAMALSPFLGGVDALGPNHPNSESLWLEASGGPSLRNLSLSFGGVSYNTALTGTQVGETVAPLFKGRAAELAVRTSAHLALNLMAMRDNSRVNAGSQQPDNRPMAATVLLDDDHRGDVATQMYTGINGGVKRFPFWQIGNTRLGTNDTRDFSAFGTATTDIKAYPFDLNGGQPGTVQRLANNNSAGAANGTPYAVNIYAAQPQPFITAAVTFDMYYDAPLAQGGDSQAGDPADLKGEWLLVSPGDPANNVAPVFRSLGVTIKGNVDLSNPDFLMEAVCFQVTNPFDTALTLSDPATGLSYYFEFAGKYYDARQYDDNGMPLNTVVKLQPRQSMCFYVLSQDPAQVLARWRAADPSIDSFASGSDTAVSLWIKKQLTVVAGNGGALRTVQINPATGAQINPGGVQRVVTSNPTADENKVVKLWRVVLDRPSGENSASANKTDNDYLVDRLHDPSFGDTSKRSGLFRRLNDDYNRFTSIPAGPEPGDGPLYQGPTEQKENVGYGITMFGAVRRRSDPTGGPLPSQTTDTTTGVMPAWCMEAKIGTAFDAPPNACNVVDANTNFVNSAVIGGVSQNDFTGFTWGGRLVHTMFQKGLQRQYTTAFKHPAERHGAGAAGSGGVGDDPADLIGNDIGDTTLNPSAPIADNLPNSVGWVAGGKAVQLPVYPRRKTPPDLAKDMELPPLRPADLLMPWAIGPYSYGDINPVPVATNLDQHTQVDERKHTTLSEAIGFGLNYSRAKDPSVAPTVPATNNKTYEYQIGRALDRCHLPTDRFVPFNDANTNAIWDYNAGNPDPFIANGIPFALNVLDRFRTQRYGTVDSIMPGLVNLNTMPLSVARMLPLVTPPSADGLTSGDNGGFLGHWMSATASGPFALKAQNETGAYVARPLWDDHDAQGSAYKNRWDVAATLIAYRDQQAVVARGAQGAETGSAIADGRVFVDFSRGGKNAGGVLAAGNDGNRYDSSTAARPGRPFITNVSNIRQDPGFQTPAEVMMAIVKDNTKRLTGQNLTPAQQKQLGITRLETDIVLDPATHKVNQTTLSDFQVPVHPIVNRSALGLTGNEVARTQAIGLTGALAVHPPTTGTGPDVFVQAGRSNDYDRKIAIANALLNTVSTSSDIYCAYFLVRGYTEADTQGLETYTGNTTPTEDRYTRPMMPSVERRYMMVVDRSNCLRAGDKPKVLMFEELPVR